MVLLLSDYLHCAFSHYFFLSRSHGCWRIEIIKVYATATTAVYFDTMNFAHLWWRWTAVACGKREAASSSTPTTTENILNEFQSVAEATNSAWHLVGRLMVTGEVPRTATRRSSPRRHLTFSLHRTSAPFPQITIVDVCRRFIIGVTLSYIGLGLLFKVTELTIRDAILTCARKPT